MKAIITDLDGTILPHGENISELTIQTLKRLGKQGIVRIIATGRTLFAARKFLPDHFPIDYLIFSSGAGTIAWSTHKMLASHHLSLQQSRFIARYLWNYNVNFCIQQEIPDNHYFYYTALYPQHPDFLRRVEKFKEFGTPVHSCEDLHKPATQFIMILAPQQIKLIDKIQKDLADFSVIRSTSPFDGKAIWLEIYPRNINKGSSCRQLLKQLHISTAECAGLGNDYNDVDFLEICGKAFVVKNAPERLRQHYKCVASDRNDGFTEFVRNVFP